MCNFPADMGFDREVSGNPAIGYCRIPFCLQKLLQHDVF